MATEQRSTTFAAFHREYASAVFDLALRHSGDRGTAAVCVDAVFSELAGRWGAISDPLRFARRAAVLFVCGTRRRHHAMRWVTPTGAVHTTHRRRAVPAAAAS